MKRKGTKRTKRKVTKRKGKTSAKTMGMRGGNRARRAWNKMFGKQERTPQLHESQRGDKNLRQAFSIPQTQVGTLGKVSAAAKQKVKSLKKIIGSSWQGAPIPAAAPPTAATDTTASAPVPVAPADPSAQLAEQPIGDGVPIKRFGVDPRVASRIRMEQQERAKGDAVESLTASADNLIRAEISEQHLAHHLEPSARFGLKEAMNNESIMSNARKASQSQNKTPNAVVMASIAAVDAEDLIKWIDTIRYPFLKSVVQKFNELLKLIGAVGVDLAREENNADLLIEYFVNLEGQRKFDNMLKRVKEIYESQSSEVMRGNISKYIDKQRTHHHWSIHLMDAVVNLENRLSALEQTVNTSSHAKSGVWQKVINCLDSAKSLKDTALKKFMGEEGKFKEEDERRFILTRERVSLWGGRKRPIFWSNYSQFIQKFELVPGEPYIADAKDGRHEFKLAKDRDDTFGGSIKRITSAEIIATMSKEERNAAALARLRMNSPDVYRVRASARGTKVP